ncbi:MAG: hypothetical protein KAJ98_11365 [Spirochaetaceae bacterium]|nr:hypothetical protein [Spirochaetaceae bacterium]
MISRIEPRSRGEGIPSYIRGVRDDGGSLSFKASIVKLFSSFATLASRGNGGLVGPLGRSSQGLHQTLSGCSNPMPVNVRCAGLLLFADSHLWWPLSPERPSEAVFFYRGNCPEAGYALQRSLSRRTLGLDCGVRFRFLFLQPAFRAECSSILPRTENPSRPAGDISAGRPGGTGIRDVLRCCVPTDET